MSGKFHINKHGVPAPCNAKEGNCPYGGESGNENHFDTLEEAEKHANELNAAKYGLLKDNPYLDGNEDDFEDVEDAQKAQDNLNESTYGMNDELKDEFYKEHYYPGNDMSSSQMGHFKTTIDADENDPVDKAFIDKFGKDALIAEIESDDPMKYSLDSNDDGIFYSNEALFDDVEKEGYDTSRVFSNKDEYEYTPEFREAYGNYLKSKQGPTKKMFGKEFASIVNPANDKDAREFVKSFLDNQDMKDKPVASVTPEVEKEFNNEHYYPGNDISSSQMGYFKTTIGADENDPVDKAFVTTFGKDALITEVDSDDPMKYSLDSNDDGMFYSHEDLLNDVESEGYDTSKVFANKHEYEYTPEFRESYGNYLKSRQGPTKELFGKRFASIVNPANDEGAREFVKSFIGKR